MQHAADRSVFLVFEITAYLPDSLVPRYISLRDTVLSWLKSFGIGSDESNASEGNRMQIVVHGSVCADGPL